MYDVRGNASKIDDRTFTYSAIHGKVTSETWSVGKKTLKKKYIYDSDGTTTNFSVQIGEQAKLSYNYEYDGEAKLKKIVQKDAGKNETIATYDYDANGALIRENGQKVETDFKYNLNGMVTEMENRSKAGVLLSKYSASYAKNSQKTEETKEVRGNDGMIEKKKSQYYYDSLGRLAKERNTGEEEIYYSYDAHNNRKEMKSASQTVSYRYNKNDELQRSTVLNNKTEKVSVTLYKYDKNGNQLATVNRRKADIMSSSPQFDLNVTLGANRLNDNVINHYDAQNQQQEILTKNYKIKYTYDDEGLRISKIVNGKKRYYIWDGDQLIMEIDEEGEIVRRYIRGLNLIYSDSGIGTARQYFVQDMHGSVVQLLNETDSIVKKYTYNAFGNEIGKDKTDENVFRYCGEYYDKETDTLYLRARSYDARTGRFLTSDTYKGEERDISSLNLYTYCNNDSVNQVDPSGHWGRTAGFGVFQYGKNGLDKYVHKTITMKAAKVSISSLYPKKLLDFFTRWQAKMIEGAILPDYVQSKSRNSYQFYHIGYYKKFNKGKIYNYYMLGDKGKDTFHGKKRKYLNDLRNTAMNEFGKSRVFKDQEFVLLGCVLHAIQDYPAHSYVSELKAFIDNMKKHKQENIRTGRRYKSKSDEEYQMVTVYHSDWSYVGGEIKPNKSTHKDNKDNPYMDFVKQDGEWKWIPKRFQDNRRYISAVNSSRYYYRRAIKILK